jgi:hypothetical protein
MHELFGSEVREGRPRSDVSDATLLLTDRYLNQVEQRETWARLPEAQRAMTPPPNGKSIEDLARDVVQEVYKYERDPNVKNEDSLVRAVCERFHNDRDALIQDFTANARFEADTRRVAQVLLGLMEGMSVSVDFGVTRQLHLVSEAARSR